jgi:alpha-tubulin suppressor-like RCC1 family protein
VKSPRVFTDITAAPYSTCALDTGGKATCWGANNSFVRPETFKQVVAGEKYHCGITTTDELSCWESYGQHVNWNTLPYDTFSKLAIGTSHACALRKNGGTARCWGSIDQAIVPTKAFVDIVAAAEHTCALDAAGNITCWGQDYRMGGVAPPTGAFKKLSASPYLFCGLRDTGALVCWGSYVSGIYGNMAGTSTPHDFGGNYVELAAGSGEACGIDASHVVHCVGFTNGSDAGLEGKLYTKVAFGSGHRCAIDVDGEAVCFGTSTSATNPPSP